MQLSAFLLLLLACAVSGAKFQGTISPSGRSRQAGQPLVRGVHKEGVRQSAITGNTLNQERTFLMGGATRGRGRFSREAHAADAANGRTAVQRGEGYSFFARAVREARTSHSLGAMQCARRSVHWLLLGNSGSEYVVIT